MSSGQSPPSTMRCCHMTCSLVSVWVWKLLIETKNIILTSSWNIYIIPPACWATSWATRASSSWSVSETEGERITITLINFSNLTTFTESEAPAYINFLLVRFFPAASFYGCFASSNFQLFTIATHSGRYIQKVYAPLILSRWCYAVFGENG